ncbi:PAS domain-containing protein, partial [Nocardiopsis tropica]|nr:PAS domain-containing protein [Nocardiopsis tropica]
MGSGRKADHPAEDSGGGAAHPSDDPGQGADPASAEAAAARGASPRTGPAPWNEPPSVALMDVAGASAGLAGAPLHADDLPDGVVVADAAGRVVLFNTQAAQLTGVPTDAALGRDYRAVLPLVGHD